MGYDLYKRPTHTYNFLVVIVEEYDDVIGPYVVGHFPEHCCEVLVVCCVSARS